MRQCRRMNVVGCSFLDNDNCGVLLDNVTHCRVSDCLIRDDRATVTNSLALRLTKGQGNMIVNNMLGGGSDIANGSARVSGNYDGS
jgi:hypothetical protein